MSSLWARPSWGIQLKTRDSWLPCSAISVPSSVSSQCLEERNSAEITCTTGNKHGSTYCISHRAFDCDSLTSAASSWNLRHREPGDSSRPRRWPDDPPRGWSPRPGCPRRRPPSQPAVKASPTHRCPPCCSSTKPERDRTWRHFLGGRTSRSS